MTKKLRVALGAIFIAAFLAIAPVLILYSAGYRYHAQKRRIEKTGIIRVETEPTEARALLNGKPSSKTTPLSFSRLLPEDYRLRIEKAGYLPWEGDVEVQSGQTAFVVGVRLYRDMLPELTKPGHFSDAAWHDATGKVALVREEEDKVEIITLDGGQETLLARYAPDAHETLTLAWSPDATAVLATGTRKDGTTLAYRLAGEGGRIESQGLHDLFPKQSIIARWLDDDTIGIATREGAFSVGASGEPVSLAYVDGITDLVANGRTIYVVRSVPSGAAVSRIDAGQLVDVAFLPAGDWRFVDGNASPLLLTDARRGRLAMVREGSEPEFHDATRAIRGSNDTFLLWNDFEISILDARSGARRVATRLSTAITDVAWLPDGSIAFSTANGVALLQPDIDGYRDAIDLIRFTDIGPFHVDPEATTLQFLGTVGNMSGLYEREL